MTGALDLTDKHEDKPVGIAKDSLMDEQKDAKEVE